MKVAVPKEIHPGERRVAATPETTRKLRLLGFEVLVEAGAGELAAFPDSAYAQAGAVIIQDVRELWAAADVVLKVDPPELNKQLNSHEAELMHEGQALVSFVWPAKNTQLLERLAARRATVLAMDQIPRITRAQKMDALSSMANIAGYRAVIEAASFFGRFFTGQMTAAGKVPPAKVLVIGAGVAGLSAVGTARSLGAIVRAFDTRPTVKEQVRSMGAEFLELAFEEDGTGQGGYAKVMSDAFIAAEMNLFRKQCQDVDIVITTALIPGRPAPQLLTREMVELMRPGSVIVDLAAEAGGNCEVTRPQEVVVHRGVTVIGYVDLPSRLAATASQLYGTNLMHLLTEMGGAAKWHIDHDDEVVRGALILERGEMRWPAPARDVPAPLAAAKPPQAPPHRAPPRSRTGWLLAICALALLGVGWGAPPSFVNHFTVFVLACVVGWLVVWNVTPALHTPLMSVTNAISGIILVGGMLHMGGAPTELITWLAACAVLVSTINVVGGFLVTHRMLRMFQK